MAIRQKLRRRSLPRRRETGENTAGQALGQAVYVGIGKERGVMIRESEAFAYALARCLYGPEEDRARFEGMLVEWFYSDGNWVKEN